MLNPTVLTLVIKLSQSVALLVLIIHFPSALLGKLPLESLNSIGAQTVTHPLLMSIGVFNTNVAVTVEV